MYHCCLRFYLTGRQCKAFEVFPKMSPLEHFTHTFYQSEAAEEKSASEADVIFASLEGMDAENIRRTITVCGGREASLIVLAGADQFPILSEDLEKITDVWMLPMTEEEAVFRFLRWQQTCKLEKDFWEKSQYLEAAINSVPNLV